MVCVPKRIKLKEIFDLKQVNNLDELIDLVGESAVSKCFTEYMMITIAKAQKLDDLQRHIESLAKMSNGEMSLRSGDLLTMLNAPLFFSIDEG